MRNSFPMNARAANRFGHLLSGAAVLVLSLGVTSTVAHGSDSKENQVVVMVFPRGDADPMVAVRIER